MNKKNLIGIGALTLALAGSLAFLGAPKEAEQARAADLSPYSIGDDEFEVAFLEQYMTSSSLDSYSYVDDKPLGGNNAVGGHLYGNGVTYATDLVTNLNSGVNETLQWNFTSTRVRGKADPNRAYVQIETSATYNMKDASMYPEATKPDEYGIANLFSASYSHVSAMYTTTAIKNITDISFYWRSSYTKRAYLCYQIDGTSNWVRFADIQRNDAGDIKGNYSGTRGWDKYGYKVTASSSWATSPLNGATAKIAIACTEKSSSEEGNFPVSAIVINANKAAVRYLNVLSYQDNVCSDNGANKSFDLNKGQADNVHNQDLFQLATENAEAAFLDSYTVNGSKTSATSALDLYNHLVTNVSGLGSVKGVAQHYNLISNNKNTLVPAVIITCVVSASAMTILILIKKRKHN